MTGLRTLWTVAAKDLRLERHTHDIVGSTGLFALLIVVTASFTLPASATGQPAVAAGMLWMAILFASLLGVGRAQSIEDDQRGLDTLLLAPVGREYLYLGKLLASLILMWTVIAVLVPLSVVLLRLHVASAGLLVAAVLLGTTGLTGIGTLFGMSVSHTRVQQPLLPVLVMPVAIPLMIASVQVTAASLGDIDAGAGTFASSARWLALLVGFDAVVLLIAVLAIAYLVEE
jgi:heme exporter protein B